MVDCLKAWYDGTGVILQKSLGGGLKLIIVCMEITTLIYCVMADCTHYVTHVHCALFVENGKSGVGHSRSKGSFAPLETTEGSFSSACGDWKCAECFASA